MDRNEETMYSKILVPVDGSQNSLRALSQGLFLASKMNSKLTIVYVTEIPPFVYIQSQKIIAFRNECNNYRFWTGLKDAGLLAVGSVLGGFAIYGIYSIWDQFNNKS